MTLYNREGVRRVYAYDNDHDARDSGQAAVRAVFQACMLLTAEGARLLRRNQR